MVYRYVEQALQCYRKGDRQTARQYWQLAIEQLQLKSLP